MQHREDVFAPTRSVGEQLGLGLISGLGHEKDTEKAMTTARPTPISSDPFLVTSVAHDVTTTYQQKM